MRPALEEALARSKGTNSWKPVSLSVHLPPRVAGAVGCVEITCERHCRHLGWGVHGYQNLKLLDSLIWAKGCVTKTKGYVTIVPTIAVHASYPNSCLFFKENFKIMVKNTKHELYRRDCKCAWFSAVRHTHSVARPSARNFSSLHS